MGKGLPGTYTLAYFGLVFIGEEEKVSNVEAREQYFKYFFNLELKT